jgi:hypothetical protein
VVEDAAAIYGWSTWPAYAIPGEGFAVSVGARVRMVLWVEPDDFNSGCLGIRVARVHWRLDAEDHGNPGTLAEIKTRVEGGLSACPYELISTTVLGHEPSALELFQAAGFRFVGSNVWLYRPPSAAPVIPVPDGIELCFRDIKSDPLPPADVAQMIELARLCFFHDRFSLDVRVGAERARSRFEAVIGNGLRGDIADFVLTAYSGISPVGFVFFGADDTTPPRAGRWLTALIHPGMRGRELGEALVAKAIEMLPVGEAHWSYKCTLQNLPSFEASRRLGFRLGAVAHDLHFWKAR